MLLNIEVQQARSGKWYWKLISGKNGKPVAFSPTYSSKQMCLKTATKLYEDIRINRLDLVERVKSSAKECYIATMLRHRNFEDEMDEHMLAKGLCDFDDDDYYY